MAQLTTGTGFPLRFDDLDLSVLLAGQVATANGTTFTVSFPDGYRETLSGTGFTYNFLGIPRGGTITGFRETLNGATTFEVTGLSISITEFISLAQSGGTSAALQGLLRANDGLIGGALDDLFLGYDGHDNLFGGPGSDTMDGGAGNDHLYGQSADGGPDGGDLILGGDGSDYLQGNAGTDILDGGNGSDRINGGGDADSMRGGAGNDTINGNLGDDSIDGGADNDSLRGGQGNDVIGGGAGNDQLFGDLGVDVLTGGAGADIFGFPGNSAVFAGAAADRVADFENGIDKLTLGFVPVVVLTGSAADFTTAATLAQSLFDGRAGQGEAAAIQVGGDSYVFFDSAGGLVAASAVQLVGVSASAIDLGDFT